MFSPHGKRGPLPQVPEHPFHLLLCLVKMESDVI